MFEMTAAVRPTSPLIPGQKLTIEEVSQLPKNGCKYELIEGELIMSPTGIEHEATGMQLIRRLIKYLDEHPIGELYGSSAGFQLSATTLLSPDLSFVRNEQLPGGKPPRGFAHFAPDLVVEVVSPNDRLSDVAEKVELYFAHGTRLVWALDPVRRRATVHHPDDTARTLRPNESLDGEDVLPSFTCRLSDIL